MDKLNTLQQIKSNKEYSIIGEFVENSDKCGMIGGYCEHGFPLFYVNDNMIKMLHYDSKEEFIKAIDSKVENLIYPEDLPQVLNDLGANYYEGMTYESSYRMSRKDGSLFWTMDRGKVIKTEDNRLAIISMCSDLTIVTDRQKEFQEKSYKNEQTLLNIPGGYHRCSQEDGYPFLYISERFLEMTGWTREEIVKKFDNKFINMVFPDDENLVNEYVDVVEKHHNSNEKYLDGIYRISCKDGYRWFSDSSVLVKIGNDSFLQGVLSDITLFIEKEKQNQEELKAALKQAEVAAQAKTNFLFNISHEIRTPLNAIQGFNELARKHINNSNKALDALNKASIAGKQLLGTINEILDMSRIQSGKLVLNIGTIDVKKHIKSISTIFDQMAKQKGITFETIDNTEARYVCGDGQRISQILTNLLGNAIKFTPKGGKIIYQIDEKLSNENNKITYTIKIKDNGIGMSQDFQEKMYDTFERELHEDKITQGSGLGLSIVKRLTEEMNGSIVCNSELGKGTEFIFKCTLPITEVDNSNDREINNEFDLNGIRILLVEDNELNREIAIAILEDYGILVETANNGLEAVEKVMNASDNYYKIILMDVQMPIMNGYKATSEIRKLNDPQKASIPIIAMTANAFAEDKKKALDIGMNDHIAKPIDAKKLIQTIALLIQK